MDRSRGKARRSVRLPLGNETLEPRELLSNGGWPPYISTAQLYNLLNNPPGYPAVRPNTPVLPYGVASKLATYVDPSAHVINGYAVIIGAQLHRSVLHAQRPRRHHQDWQRDGHPG